MSVIKKAVIPVAGLGTRMLPATKSIPKEMLPLVDRPLIQLIVEECISAGIKEIVLVTHSAKHAVENHFDSHFELEDSLVRKNKQALLAELRAICPDDVSIMAVRQGEARGLGHAVMCARPFVGDEPFAVMLPDVVMDNLHGAPDHSNNLARMIDLFDETGVSQVMVAPVPAEEVSSYGIVDVQGESISPGASALMTRVVEKPTRDEAPSNLSIVGRYVLSAEIWPLLAGTPAGAGGEIQLTDAISALMQQHPVAAFSMLGQSHDCGNKLGYAQTFVESALMHPDIREAFCEWLGQRLKAG